jgi:hypothetical protein
MPILVHGGNQQILGGGKRERRGRGRERTKLLRKHASTNHNHGVCGLQGTTLGHPLPTCQREQDSIKNKEVSFRYCNSSNILLFMQRPIIEEKLFLKAIEAASVARDYDLYEKFMEAYVSEQVKYVGERKESKE